MEKVDIVVIGAGVVGLSIATELANPKYYVYVLEKNSSFGQEISSRNSEVIHTGIYYEPGSLKAKTCVDGNKMLYELCIKNNIPYRKLGKLIVAVSKEEEKQLFELFNKGKKNGVKGLKILSQSEVKKIEPYVECTLALFSPDTGIIDSHKLMLHLIQRLKEKGAEVVYNCEVIGISKTSSGYIITVKDTLKNEEFKFFSSIVINSTGLNSEQIAEMVGIDTKAQKYNLKYCKGQYFRVNNSKKCGFINHLVYPVPEHENGTLGIHATLDLVHSIRLGPDAQYLERNEIDYNVDIRKRKEFLNSVINFLPFLEEDDLMPDLAGIRPKLQGRGEVFRDFIIKEESALGFPGFINLIGIESPGLTSALAIAKMVKNIVEKII